MATESVNASVNGSYGSQHAYGAVETSTPAHPLDPAGNTTNGAGSGQPLNTATASDAPGAAESNGNVSKDEVGWYFVEQYYTTLSRNPEKLHVSSMKKPTALHRGLLASGLANHLVALLLKAISIRVRRGSGKSFCICRAACKCHNVVEYDF